MQQNKEVTRAQYIQFMRYATKRQVIFINTYLKTLNGKIAYQKAGYSTKSTAVGMYKLFHRLLPYINYKLNHSKIKISKDFIVAKWLQLLQTSSDSVKIAALKQLAKLYGYDSDSTKIEVKTDLNKNPVKIIFSQEKENGKDVMAKE